ncbi:MAG: hypothetical protein H5T84_10360, partial [Thermoleophilia bacterium]|nr:hypothetical protein [Thermoleophilia bacterium]
MSTTETPPSSSLAVRFGVRAALLLIAVFAPIFAVVGVEPAHAGRASLPDVSPGAASATTADVPLVVKVAPGAPAPDFTALGFRVKDAITAHGIYVLEPTRIDRPTAAQGGVTRSTERAEPAGGTFSDLPLSAREAISRLRAVPGVKWAEPAASRRMCLVPNDPFYSPRGQSPGQWYLPQVGLPTAWGVVTGSADVTVAILDTGINKDLPDFVGRVVWPYSAVDKRSDWPYWQDKDGHGTAV